MLLCCRVLKNLRELNLDKGRFGDIGLGLLTTLTALRSLSLCYCNSITDTGLRDLLLRLSCNSLAHVDVNGCARLTSRSSVGLDSSPQSPMQTYMLPFMCLCGQLRCTNHSLLDALHALFCHSLAHPDVYGCARFAELRAVGPGSSLMCNAACLWLHNQDL